MGQHDEHSEVYLRIMTRRRRRKIRKRIALITAGVLTITAVCCGFDIETAGPDVETPPATEAEKQTETETESKSSVSLESLDLTTKVITILVEAQPEPEIVQPEPEVQPEVQPVHTERLWTDKEAYLLARLAMAEAESEDTESKALVIRTVLNRVQSDYFPDTIEEVIFQKNQFTPIHNGRWDRVHPNDDCWAALALVESGWDESQGALYFAVTTDKPTWHNTALKKLFEHGVMTFYTEEVSGK